MLIICTRLLGIKRVTVSLVKARRFLLAVLPLLSARRIIGSWKEVAEAFRPRKPEIRHAGYVEACKAARLKVRRRIVSMVQTLN